MEVLAEDHCKLTRNSGRQSSQAPPGERRGCRCVLSAAWAPCCAMAGGSVHRLKSLRPLRMCQGAQLWCEGKKGERTATTGMTRAPNDSLKQGFHEANMGRWSSSAAQHSSNDASCGAGGLHQGGVFPHLLCFTFLWLIADGRHWQQPRQPKEPRHSVSGLRSHTQPILHAVNLHSNFFHAIIRRGNGVVSANLKETHSPWQCQPP